MVPCADPANLDTLSQLSGENRQGVPIYDHVSLKHRHPKEGQRKHTGNVTAKSSMNLWDKSLEGFIPNKMAALGGVLAGSSGAS